MVSRARYWLVAGSLAALCLPAAFGQVFVVGKNTATDGLVTEFHPTRVELPAQPLTERGRRDLLRMLEAEQGFAHRALPMGGQGLTLRANGTLSPDSDTIRDALYKKGVSAQAGDRVMVTNLQFEKDRIIVDLDGGPYKKHRWLSHIQLNNNNVVAPEEQPTGARVVLVFERFIPDLTASEVKSLLEPVIDFGVKTSEEAYANTLPEPLKLAVADHRVLVGMNHRMVLAALGQPVMKVREKVDDSTGDKYEEWIYGRTPQTIRFVRFVGDRVVLLKIAELGKPIEVRDKDEMAGYVNPDSVREIAMGDKRPGEEDDGKQAPPPTLRRSSEGPAPGAPGRVQLPDTKNDKADKPEQQFVSNLR
ncbi:DUF2845 domain-containing protein [Terriglobus tenax]|uniref:DUF2845 domain-containing protein n=1 Tax=Terriglobus tenax TaxID=1111115 RepID=UPI0021E0F7D6|nr:DUF2845 domain-containing protein [Terriglobus tenax]